MCVRERVHHGTKGSNTTITDSHYVCMHTHKNTSSHTHLFTDSLAKTLVKNMIHPEKLGSQIVLLHILGIIDDTALCADAARRVDEGGGGGC